MRGFIPQPSLSRLQLAAVLGKAGLEDPSWAGDDGTPFPPPPTLSRHIHSRTHSTGHKLQVLVSLGKAGDPDVGGSLGNPVLHLPSAPMVVRLIESKSECEAQQRPCSKPLNFT